MTTFVTIITTVVCCVIGFYCGFRSARKTEKERIDKIEKQLAELFDCHTKEELKQVGQLIRKNKLKENKKTK